MLGFTELPQHLPAPIDDGACAHMLGARLSEVTLTSTSGRQLSLSSIEGKVVFYCYPMMGQPGVPLPDNWVQIPGACGCTPQSCAFRDYYAEFQALGVQIYGISTQDSLSQQQAVERLHLPFEILSDADLKLTTALRLPTFEVEGKRLIKRLTLITNKGKIVKVFYPVFPPDINAQEAIEWLVQNAG